MIRTIDATNAMPALPAQCMRMRACGSMRHMCCR